MKGTAKRNLALLLAMLCLVSTPLTTYQTADAGSITWQEESERISEQESERTEKKEEETQKWTQEIESERNIGSTVETGGSETEKPKETEERKESGKNISRPERKQKLQEKQPRADIGLEAESMYLKARAKGVALNKASGVTVGNVKTQLPQGYEAYVRKIRSYFISSLRNVSKLPPKELSSFKQFIELFKNKNLQREPSKWSDIDVEHLIEVFKEKVKNETPSKLSAYITRLTDLFEKITVDKKELAFHPLGFAIRPTYEVYSANEKFRLENQVLDAVIQSYYYIAKSTYVKQGWHINFLIRNIYVAARYHIFSSDSDDDFNSKKKIASYN